MEKEWRGVGWEVWWGWRDKGNVKGDLGMRGKGRVKVRENDGVRDWREDRDEEGGKGGGGVGEEVVVCL